MANEIPGTENLRIAIVSTPKTGNTWLKLLLAEIYGLPVAVLPPSLDPAAWARLGPRWVAHQHYLPDPALLEWAREERVIFLTTVRHPGDVLVSLRHYLFRSGVSAGSDPTRPEWLLRDPPEDFGGHARDYLEKGFFLLLQNSICWFCGGWARPVRYEALVGRATDTLREITDAVFPVSDARLERAVAACDINRLRKRSEAERQFFRRGGAGAWREELPLALQSVLFGTEPYRTQLDLLGYPQERPVALPSSAKSLVSASPVLVELAREFPLEADSKRFDPEAYVAWLNGGCADDPVTDGTPMLSELAYRIYRRVPEAIRQYPEPFGRDRVLVSNWFLHFGLSGFGLDRAFAETVIRSWSQGSFVQTLQENPFDAP